MEKGDSVNRDCPHHHHHHQEQRHCLSSSFQILLFTSESTSFNRGSESKPLKSLGFKGPVLYMWDCEQLKAAAASLCVTVCRSEHSYCNAKIHTHQHFSSTKEQKLKALCKFLLRICKSINEKWFPTVLEHKVLYNKKTMQQVSRKSESATSQQKSSKSSWLFFKAATFHLYVQSVCKW